MRKQGYRTLEETNDEGGSEGPVVFSIGDDSDVSLSVQHITLIMYCMVYWYSLLFFCLMLAYRLHVSYVWHTQIETVLV